MKGQNNWGLKGGKMTNILLLIIIIAELIMVIANQFGD